MTTVQLSKIADIVISSVDKKTKTNEQSVRLCNFVDVYHNWAITNALHDDFMEATARPAQMEKFKLKKGQVAITKDSETRDDIGVSTYIADDFDDVVLGYHCALITPDESVLNGKYLNALLHTSYAQKYFANNAAGSGQRYALSVEAITSMPIPLVPIEEQNRIGDVFSMLDKKICLNRQINHNLEALAKQLYDYWFVQFDFPDENGKPYKSNGGKMVYNAQLKREIPEDWEVKEIGEILGKIQSTPRLTTDEYMLNGNFPIIDQTTDVYYAGFTDREDAVLKQYPAVVFGDHSCAVKYVNFPFVRGADGTQIMISKDSRISVEYLYFAIQSVKMSKGYARHFGFLKGSLVIRPSQSVAYLFKDKVTTWLEAITSNRRQNLSFIKLRDELLPLLMNGQVLLNCD